MLRVHEEGDHTDHGSGDHGHDHGDLNQHQGQDQHQGQHQSQTQQTVVKAGGGGTTIIAPIVVGAFGASRAAGCSTCDHVRRKKRVVIPVIKDGTGGGDSVWNCNNDPTKHYDSTLRYCIPNEQD